MALSFVNQRFPKISNALSSNEMLQLIQCGKNYHRLTKTAEEWIAIPDDDDDGLYGLELWDVVDINNNVVYNIWTYNVDSGIIFNAKNNKEVGIFIQSYLQCEDKKLRVDLKLAHLNYLNCSSEQTALSGMHI